MNSHGVIDITDIARIDEFVTWMTLLAFKTLLNLDIAILSVVPYATTGHTSLLACTWRPKRNLSVLFETFSWESPLFTRLPEFALTQIWLTKNLQTKNRIPWFWQMEQEWKQTKWRISKLGYHRYWCKHHRIFSKMADDMIFNALCFFVLIISIFGYN